MESLNCGICYNPYNREEFTPFMLANWGHSLWRTCLLAINGSGRQRLQCPMWKVEVTTQPKPNYALLDVIDEDVKEETFIIKFGKVPHFVDVVTLRENFLNHFENQEDIVSIKYEDDPNSYFYHTMSDHSGDSGEWEEKLVSVEYKGVKRKLTIDLFDGKVFTMNNSEMHLMLNVTSVENKSLHPDVRGILKAKGYDLVFLIPSKPAFGYDFCIKMNQKFISKDMKSKKS